MSGVTSRSYRSLVQRGPPRLDVHGTLPHRLLPSGRARTLARAGPTPHL